ncbi:hypothetical protein Bbelb_120370 [Branchiostoma belcheri]|nr:hypothetical protein Bbelb_120370 [Branchiostoma belcheri]
MSNKARRMLVLLLIILKEAGPTAACSSSCSWSDCYSSCTQCVCRSRGLSGVPQDLPTDITVLNLRYNVITTLNQSDFSRQRMNGSYRFESQITCAGPANLRNQLLRDVNPDNLICEEKTPVYSTSSTESNIGPADDEDPDTAEYDTIDEVNQSEIPHQDAGNTQSLDSFGYLNLPPSLPPRNQTAAQIEPDAAARAMVSPSQTSQPGSGQIQHLGSFNDGYEVPFPSLYPGEGPQSHKYVNSHVAAAAKDAAAGPQDVLYGYENDEESVNNQSQTAAAPGADSPHQIQSADAAGAIGGRDTWTDEDDDVLSPSQTSQPGSGQIQHLGSFNDGYEEPSRLLYTALMPPGLRHN